MIIMIDDPPPSVVFGCYLDFDGDFSWRTEGNQIIIERLIGYAIITLEKVNKIADFEKIRV